MTYTEEEAKSKFCPVAVSMNVEAYSDGLIAGNTPPSNRIYDTISRKTIIRAGCRCLGSICMAWRVLRAEQHGETHIMPPGLMKSGLLEDPSVKDDVIAWGEAQKTAGRVPASGLQVTLIFGVPTRWRDSETVTGYCGLAGKP